MTGKDENMKKALFTVFALTVALALSATAAPDANKAKNGEKAKPTAEQKALLKEIKTKYDTDKDGKFSKEERSKISTADKEKMEKAGVGHKKGKKKE